SSVFDQGQHSQMPNVQITHGRLDESDISDTDFIGYVYRRYDGDGLGREWLVRNREVLGLVDRSAGHGLHSWYVGYRHYVNAGADIVDSEMVKATAMVNIRHTVITHDESDVAVTFKFWRERRVEQQVGTEVIVPLGRQKPYGLQSPTRYGRIRRVCRGGRLRVRAREPGRGAGRHRGGRPARPAAPLRVPVADAVWSDGGRLQATIRGGGRGCGPTDRRDGPRDGRGGHPAGR